MAEALAQIGIRVQARPRVAVVVMGMHRSGTSALARVLNLLGCQTPQTLMTAHEFNPRGHWESENIRQFNDELLQAAGSGWSDWAPVNPGFAKSPVYAAWLDRAVALLGQEFGASPLVVFKDPRICRLGGFWMDALERFDCDPAVVLPLRNPLEVAASLAQRDGIDESYAQLLWLRHVLDAEISTRGRRRVFTTFADLLDGWESLVARISAELGIGWPRFSLQVAGEITDSLDAALKHHARLSRAVTANPGLSAWLRDSYATLENWAQHGEDARDYARIDEIRAQFDAATPAFAKLIHGGEQARTRVLTLETRIAELHQTSQDMLGLQQQLAELRGDQALLGEERQRSQALADAVQSLQDRLAAQDSALRQKQAEAERAWAETAAGRQAITVSGQENGQLAQRIAALSGSLADSQGWVFRLAAERQQAEQHAQRLIRDLQRLTRKSDVLKAEAARLREALVAEQRLRRDEAGERDNRPDFSAAAGFAGGKLHLDGRHADIVHPDDPPKPAAEQALPVGADISAKHLALQTELHGARRAIAEAARLRDEHVAELVLLSRKLQAHEAAARAWRENDTSSAPAPALALASVADLVDDPTPRELAEQQDRHSQAEIHSLRKALAAAQRRQDESSSELVTLTRKLLATEKAATYQRDRVEWLGSIALAVDHLPWWWHLLPSAMRRARVRGRLCRRGLFDGDAYLARNADVRAKGVDPLRHYLRHGMAEGRRR